MRGQLGEEADGPVSVVHGLLPLSHALHRPVKDLPEVLQLPLHPPGLGLELGHEVVFGQLRLACLEGDGDEGIQGRGHVRRELVYVGRQKVDLQRHHPHTVTARLVGGGVGGGGGRVVRPHQGYM